RPIARTAGRCDRGGGYAVRPPIRSFGPRNVASFAVAPFAFANPRAYCKRSAASLAMSAMADRDPHLPPIEAPAAQRISRERMVLLFLVMLVTAAGNTAMQSVMPSVGTALGVADVWISIAYTWSALLWVICAPIWARRSDRRGRKAMMAIGLVGFIASFALCGLVLMFGLAGAISAAATLMFFAAARSLYGGFGSAAPPAVQAYVASR